MIAIDVVDSSTLLSTAYPTSNRLHTTVVNQGSETVYITDTSTASARSSLRLHPGDSATFTLTGGDRLFGFTESPTQKSTVLVCWNVTSVVRGTVNQ